MNRKEEMPLFQSTLPMRGATEDAAYMIPKGAISIHAPHAGSDNEVNENVKLDTNFNPRSPCGERPAFSAPEAMLFAISIHAPHAGSDLLLIIKH